MIKIYTTPTCVFCEMAKGFFEEKGIAYKEFDVSKDEKAQKEMLEKTHQLAVPVFDIDGKIIINFDRAQLEEAIKNKCRPTQKIPRQSALSRQKSTSEKYGIRLNNRRRRAGRSSRRSLRQPKKT